MFESIVGASVGMHSIDYTWRDMALYALAVGADENDLLYTYEKNMKAIPSFGVLPYFSAINVVPPKPKSFSGSYLAHELVMKELGYKFNIGLHMGHELVMHRPFDPIKGTMVFDDIITNIYDRGEGKGIIVESECPVYDAAGNLVCTNISRSLLPEGGGFGGPAPDKGKLAYPDRTPDYVVDEVLSKTANVLYRLTGDTDAHHIDPEVGNEVTHGRGAFMHGLASFGYACRMLIKGFIPGEPERMKRMVVQMRSISYPGTPVQLQAWKVEGENRALFRYIDVESGKAILDNCEFEWI